MNLLFRSQFFYIPGQLCCRGMCEFVTWLHDHQQNQSMTNSNKMSIMIKTVLVEGVASSSR